MRLTPGSPLGCRHHPMDRRARLPELLHLRGVHRAGRERRVPADDLAGQGAARAISCQILALDRPPRGDGHAALKRNMPSNPCSPASPAHSPAPPRHVLGDARAAQVPARPLSPHEKGHPPSPSKPSQAAHEAPLPRVPTSGCRLPPPNPTVTL
nr:hypothetical protein CFP56_19295 [Quercus suber]